MPSPQKAYDFLTEAEKVRSNSCIICGSTDTSKVTSLRTQNHLSPEKLKLSSTDYGTTLPLRQCDHCGVVFAEQRFLENSIPSDEISDLEYVYSLKGRVEEAVWVLAQGLMANPEARSILDVGAGMGCLVEQAKKHGLRAVGVEPSKFLANTCEKRCGIQLINDFFPITKSELKEKFDLIFLVNVIDHVPDPVAFLSAAAHLLSPKGKVIVVTPNNSSLTAKIMGRKWWHFRLANIVYFNDQTFSMAAKFSGLKVTRSCFSPSFLPWSYIQKSITKLFLGYKNQNSDFVSSTKQIFDPSRVIRFNLLDSKCYILASANSAHDSSGKDTLTSKINLLKPYISVARLDHWIKNLFALPGFWLATNFISDKFHLGDKDFYSLFWGLISLCIASSANYVINEYLDAEGDVYHPKKKFRPSPSGKVHGKGIAVEWGLLTLFSLGVANLLSFPFVISVIALLIMGIVYNLRPLRTKDIPFVDVLSESINNPIRMLAGWYMINPAYHLPPISLLLSYWMLGGFFMALKRFAEIRKLKNHIRPEFYRKSLSQYSESGLLASSLIYCVAASFFLGCFFVSFHIELVLASPFIFWFLIIYFNLSFKEDGFVDSPEKLWKKTHLIVALSFSIAAILILSNVDIPQVQRFLGPR